MFKPERSFPRSSTPILTLALLAGLLLSLSHCGSVKYESLLMLEEIQQERLMVDSVPALTIRTDDILGIQVTSRNPELVVAFQLNSYQRSSGSSGEQAYGVTEGYRVDENGQIFLPFLGRVEAQGKNIITLREEIATELAKYIPDASVQIRFLNFRVTVLGEVNQPSTYTIPNEQLTILDAIGMAGDFTPYAKRENVLIIRERDNVRDLGRINTQDLEIFESPYFYLSPNDIVYVEPQKAKKYATSGDFLTRYSVVIFPLVSLATFILGATAFRN